MGHNFKITKALTDSIVKIGFASMEFSRLYDIESPKSAKSLFECNQEIVLGIRWFIASENTKSMLENVEAYLKSVETTLEVYNSLTLPFDNKKEIIAALYTLRHHLVQFCQLIGQ